MSWKAKRIATAMVDYGIGELVQNRIREMGVRPFYKHFEREGVCRPNITTVYSDRGQGVRPPVVFYNRANEAGTLLKPGDFDWQLIVSVAPCSGITHAAGNSKLQSVFAGYTECSWIRQVCAPDGVATSVVDRVYKQVCSTGCKIQGYAVKGLTYL